MSTPDELFERYRGAFESGEDSDPRPYLAQLSGVDRAELEALIDAYLATGPRRPFDPETFAAFASSELGQRIGASVSERLDETWATLLPAARHAAEIPRTRLVASLAQELGVGDRAEKVGDYYHRMEQGMLPATGVSDRVLEALGRIVGVSAQRLREAGRRLAPPAPGGAAEVFARSAPAPVAAPASEASVLREMRREPERDEVDELFTGG